MTPKKLVFTINKEWEAFRKAYPWLVFIPETAIDSKGREFIRKKGSDILYIQKNGSENPRYQCSECNSDILSVEVTHQLHYRSIQSPGSSQQLIEIVPYCPICEEEPDRYGKSIEQRSMN